MGSSGLASAENKMTPEQLKSHLARTWGAFFAQHGQFTQAQLSAIPLILSGENVVVCAPTASGKTEAALAPLIERHLPATVSPVGVRVLYILPTRALIADLGRRLAPPLERLSVSFAVKTRDLNTFNIKSPSQVVFTTPESFDSLLTSSPKLLANVRAVVLDELHISDGTPRGDHLRVLLNRLREIRRYAKAVKDAPDSHVQFVALSATLENPEAVGERYFRPLKVVKVTQKRTIDAEFIAMTNETMSPLLDCFSGFGQQGWRKAIVFCNTRNEVEDYANRVRQAQTVFGSAVFVHYSNLERERRKEIEEQFKQAEVAVCFASSTLELGIDIGNIDVAVLIGAPGSSASFWQRVGRAGRRRATRWVVCGYRNTLEREIFRTLLEANNEGSPPLMPFNDSVVIQQIFSLIKQSPRGSVRLNPLLALFDGMLEESALRAILGELESATYLKLGKADEWHAGAKLNRLFDMQGYDKNPLSLYSNIKNTDAGKIVIRERDSQRIVARVDNQWLERETLSLQGRSVSIDWYDGEAVWVSSSGETSHNAKLRYFSSRQVLSVDLAQSLTRHLGFGVNVAPLMAHENGFWVWHGLGDIYGKALFDVLKPVMRVHETETIGLTLGFFGEAFTAFPKITPESVEAMLSTHYKAYELLLAQGAYQHLLPLNVRRQSVIRLFNVARFVALIEALTVQPVTLEAESAMWEIVGAR